MKRTLQVVSAALLLAVASVTAQAQGGGGGGGGGGRGLAAQKEAMFKDITLTADQSTKIDTVLAQAQAKAMEIRTKDGVVRGTPVPDTTQAKITANTAWRTEALKKILTAEQVPIFEKNLAAMPQGRGRGGLLQ